MSKNLLSENLFTSLITFLMKGKINSHVKTLSKDPDMKKAIAGYIKSKDDLQSAVDDYAKKYGKKFDLETLR